MLQDLRFAVRSLVRARGFSIAAVLTLALGIGANTVVYGVMNGLVLRPLPFGDRGDRLVTLHSTHPTQAQDWDDSDVSYPDLLDIRAGSRTLAAVEGVINRNLSLSAEDETERVVAPRSPLACSRCSVFARRWGGTSWKRTELNRAARASRSSATISGSACMRPTRPSWDARCRSTHGWSPSSASCLRGFRSPRATTSGSLIDRR